MIWCESIHIKSNKLCLLKYNNIGIYLHYTLAYYTRYLKFGTQGT